MGVRAHFIAASVEHARALAETLRPEDWAECQAAGFTDRLETLKESLARSDLAWALLLDGEVAALFGVCGEGLVWFLTGEAFARHPFTVARLGREWVRALLEVYAQLGNYIDARYAKAIRFARLLGFQLGELTPYGPHQLPHHFALIRRS